MAVLNFRPVSVASVTQVDFTTDNRDKGKETTSPMFAAFRVGLTGFLFVKSSIYLFIS